MARRELQEALRDLSWRPESELTGAIQHAMAALECVARDITGEPKLTLGECMRRNPDLSGTARNSRRETVGLCLGI